jgi:hypothetical protein
VFLKSFSRALTEPRAVSQVEATLVNPSAAPTINNPFIVIQNNEWDWEIFIDWAAWTVA